MEKHRHAFDEVVFVGSRQGRGDTYDHLLGYAPKKALGVIPRQQGLAAVVRRPARRRW